MSTVQDMAEREEIVSALNKNPNHFLNFFGKDDHVIINGKPCLVARDRIKGGILVWGVGATFHFKWDTEHKEWF